ncbi:MAG: DUF2934 domain-containing protein [Nitrospiraceae bacterium]|nr:MAG: DUF2934 domain-containing protein [Nitrospiraceae bacterium]
MDLHEEIAKVAHELYKKSGGIGGRDFENWIDAERIVLTRHASQDIEEPEGEEPMIAEKEILEEVEGTMPRFAGRDKENYATAVEEIEVQGPALGTKEDIAIRSEKVRPAKPAVAKERKASPKKTTRKSREKFH